jgi:hypothetical protein
LPAAEEVGHRAFLGRAADEITAIESLRPAVDSSTQREPGDGLAVL